MAIASVKIVFRKDKLNEFKVAPVHIRVTKDRKPSYITTGIKLHISQWDFERNLCNRKHPNSARINNILKKTEVDVSDNVLEHHSDNLQINVQQLRQALKGKKDFNFFQVADEVLAGYKAKESAGTYHKCKSIVNKLKSYSKKDNLSFSDVSVRFIRDYEKYAMEYLKNKQNTINKDLKFIKRVFNYAIQQDYLQEIENPFKKIVIHEQHSNRDFLTVKEKRGLKIIKYQLKLLPTTNQASWLLNIFQQYAILLKSILW